MHVFLTGASGHIASGVVPELIAAGHTVTGLARSEKAASAVDSMGAAVLRGDLGDLDLLRDAARNADGVIHLAFKHDEQNAGDLAAAVEADLRAVQALGQALAGSGKPLIATNATGAMALAGFTGTLTEDDTLPGGPRVDTENAVTALAAQSVRSAVVRLPPTVHSAGVYGFASALVEIAKARAASGYPGDGTNRWGSADSGDVARLYRLALESAPAGARLHAVAEEGITLRRIAQAIGGSLGVPVVSVPADSVEDHFGQLTPFVVLDNPVSSRHTRRTLQWEPTGPGLLEQIERDHGR